jgi:Ca2+-binding EF-hand superfamily protein
MIESISGAGRSISYSFTGKDGNRDGKVGFDEFMRPVEGTACVPADTASAPTMEDIFHAYDANRDGFVSSLEMLGTRDVQRGGANLPEARRS